MKIHGNVLTIATQRVMACLYEKELDFELVPVDILTGGHKKQPFLSLNPFGLVPAFEDGDLTLFESRAITLHVAHAYEDKGTQLIYHGTKMAIASVWMEVEAHQFDPTAVKLGLELVVNPLIGKPTDAAVVEEKEAKLVQVLDIYEARLAQSKYLGGDDFTLVDLHHLPCIHRLMQSRAKKLFDSRPRVSAWCTDILARPSWLKFDHSLLAHSLSHSSYPISVQTATMKVHGAVNSTATERVFACLYEKELDFELVPVDMRAGNHKKEPYISLIPFGKVPAFEDGDLTLFESRAITLYITHAYEDKGTQLIDHGKKMAILSMWMEVEANQFDPVARKLVFELIAKPVLGMTIDVTVVEANEAKLGQVLDIYEVRLGQSKYLGGADFTLVDLHHLPCIQYLMGTDVKKQFDSRPHVSAWCADILARPAWLKVVAMQPKK